MASYIQTPFAPFEFGAGLVLIVERASTSTRWEVEIPPPPANLYANTRDDDDLAKYVCDQIAAETGLTVTRSYSRAGTSGRVRITFSGAATITLAWTDPDTTFDGTWLGFSTDADLNSEGGTDNWIKAPWQTARWFRPPQVVWSFRKPRRKVQSSKTRGGRVDWRCAPTEQDSFRPQLDLPAALLFDDPTAAALLVDLPDREDDDPNLSLEAALWRPLEDARRLPVRFTPDSDNLASFLEVQPDLDDGGSEFLEDMRSFAVPVGAGRDEAALVYSVTLPFMLYIQ